ncbi:hypothetical protein SERLA73DRAFT_56953 [Serpula lacrymans var. lacrymans S7.3]|uniref:Uncharacterized protein n=1 Tax=Serpula lacrymans var. lacrymans (strain S7.3) TaxID=936435 RepID=F8Q385_SERL3|nr:hypothetical protein SERLA73DRAFT_56953 [Serpula lacrymans var. lacrymans S7.3]
MASQAPLDIFFAAYVAFEYDASSPAIYEFNRMCQFFKWQKKGDDRNLAYMRFKDALTGQFNSTYGTDVHDYNSWKRLAEVLRISPVPDTISGCRKEIKKVFVNITDLVDTARTDKDVVLFSSEHELSRYTKKSKKFFPRNEAKAGGF